MNLLEFFNEAQVELKSPTTLQKVMDEFLSFTASADHLPPELEEAEKRVSVIRSRLEQSNLPGMTKAGKSPAKFGTIPLDDEDMRALAFAIKTVATPQDAMKLSNDLSMMPTEGLSVNGAEGLGGHGDGFEIQNQGVTRRRPGEGPKANGGRSQSQTMDSYDQPQYNEASDIGSAVSGFIDDQDRDQFIDQMGGLEAPPEPRQIDKQRYGPTGAPPVLPPAKGVFDPTRTQGTSGYDFTQDNDKLVNMLGVSPESEATREQIEEGWKQWAAGIGAAAALATPFSSKADELPQNYQSQHHFQGDLSSKQGKEVQGKADIERDKFMRDMDGGSSMGGGSRAEFEQVKAELEPLTAKKKAGTITPDEYKRAMELFPKYKQLKAQLGEIREEFMGVRDPQGFDKQDNRVGSQEVGEAVDEDKLYWKETYKDRQFEAHTDLGKFLVHKHISGTKWVFVFQPAEGITGVPYNDGYAKTAEQAKMYCQEAYDLLLKNPPDSTAAGATATAPMGSVFKGRQQLVNSVDKTELKKSSEKEQGEHPWASKKIATQIAKDHMKEEKLTLKEFFSYKEEE